MQTTHLKTWLCLAAFGFAAMGCKGEDPTLFGSQQENLRNSPSALNRRIDLIFTRGSDDFTALKANVVGEEEKDRTPSGLWPSDHAGVVATLRLPAVIPF